MACNGIVPFILRNIRFVEVVEKTRKSQGVIGLTRTATACFHKAKFMFLAKTTADNRGNQTRFGLLPPELT